MKGVKQLLGDMVLIKPDPVEAVTKGGLVIPEIAKSKPKMGTVAFIGQGEKDEPMQVQVGNRVLYESYAATDMPIDGEEYFVIPEKNILAIL